MIEESAMIGFGYQDDQDTSLKAKSSNFGLFGLNQGVVMTKCEYNPNGGPEGTPGDSLDISFKIGDKDMNQRWFPIVKVFGKNGEITDATSPEYKAAFNEQMKHFKAVMTHYMKAFNTEEALKAAFSTPPTDFVSYFKLVARMVAPGIANKVPLDLFLQYQWNIGPNNNQTFLEVPKNLKDGAFLTPHIAPNGEWKEEREWVEEGISVKGLRYVDAGGNIHKFQRTQSYMESNKAIKQTKESESSVAGNAMNAGTAGASTW